MRIVPAIGGLLLGACAAPVSGILLDAESGRPIGGAELILSTAGWGVSDGQIVWDKEYAYRVRSDAQGRFAFDQSGGSRLRVEAAGRAPMETSLCSHSPNIVRLGGAFADRPAANLAIGQGPDGRPIGWDFAARQQSSDQADLFSLGPVDREGEPSVRLRAPAGILFVGGTGDPPVPSATEYREEVRISLFECGWLFVRTRTGAIAPVQTGSYGEKQTPDGRRFLTLTYRMPQ